MHLNYCAHDNAINILNKLPDECIDMCFTDPPWGTSRLELDDDGFPGLNVWKQIKRTLKSNGWILCFAPAMAVANILAVKNLVSAWSYVWVKPSTVFTFQAKMRPSSQHELIHVFHKDTAKDRYYNSDALKTYGHSNYERKLKGRISNAYTERYVDTNMPDKTKIEDGSRVASTVLFYPPKNKMKVKERTPHPTQKNLKMCEYLINGLCPPKGVVLDPYAGSGTMILAARNVGRQYIGVEKDARWHALIEERMRSGLNEFMHTENADSN